MLLTVKDRILIVQALPKEGDVFTQRIIRDLRSKLGLSEGDWKTYDVKTDNGRVFWNPAKDIGVEYNFGEKALEIIKESLRDLDKMKKVSEDLLPLFDRFFPEEAESKEEVVAVKPAEKTVNKVS